MAGVGGLWCGENRTQYQGQDHLLFFMISQSRSPTLFPQKWDKIFQEASIFLNPLLTLIFFQPFVSHSIIAPEAVIGSDPA